MVKTSYDVLDLIRLGQNNYDKLVSYCNKLEKNGFWKEAGKVMKQSSVEVLDKQVQSVLMTLAVRCGELLEEQKEFMGFITKTNPWGFDNGVTVTNETVNECMRFAALPPILVQLCGAYDRNYGKNMCEQYIDAFLNILMCMAYINTKGDCDSKINEFIHEYFQKICLFVNGSESWNQIEYIEEKLKSPVIIYNTEALYKKKEETSLMQSFPEKYDESEDTGQNYINAENFLRNKEDKEKLRESFFARTKAFEDEENQAKEKFEEVKQRLAEREEAEKKAREARLESLIYELNALVGLEKVKEEIRSIVNLIKIRTLREQMGMPVVDFSYHMVFTGAPGTGKTTVARLVAKIYKELGVLSKGTILETDRSGLVAGYVGQTSLKVHDLVKRARGGVLFIDEAHALYNPDVPNDFGMEAVDALVKLMEDYRNDLVIIVAGYTDEMNRFIKSNTGLISRFNKYIEFPDYTGQELADIMESMAAQAGLLFTPEAKETVVSYLSSMTDKEKKDFGNARGVRNIFEKIITYQANRLVKVKNPTKEALMMVELADVVELFDHTIKNML